MSGIGLAPTFFCPVVPLKLQPLMETAVMSKTTFGASEQRCLAKQRIS